VAYEIAKELNVTLDALMSESQEIGPNDQLMLLTEEEVRILWLVREMGSREAIHRLAKVVAPPSKPEA
jgi:hypothetical protein